MRLRSSHFVFVLLLLCSVQIRDERTLLLLAGHPATRAGASTQRAEAAAAHQTAHHRATARLAAPVVLDTPSRANPRPMPHPALQAAAIAVHTSLLRA